MSLTYNFNTAKDLLEKLRRDTSELDEEVTSDKFFNLVITGYHITDWIKKDTTVPACAKSDIHRMSNDPYIAISKDIANASKHFSLSSKYPKTDSAESKQGFGVGRFGVGGFGLGEEKIEIKCTDGSKYDALDFANKLLDVWDAFFNKHGI